MRFEQLQCLREIARTGSITAAAEQLYISQQAVSKSIKQLEEEVGAPLIIRTKTGVVLTELGAEANIMAEHILNAKDYFMHGMQKGSDVYLEHKNISYGICSNSSYLTTLSPAACAQLNYKVQRISQVEAADEVIARLQDGTDHLGLLTVSEKEWDCKLQDNRMLHDISYELLEQDRLVCVKGKRYYSWEQNHISWTEFCIRHKAFYNFRTVRGMEEEDNFISVPQELGLFRNLMEYNGILALMPELVYRRFFSDKRFMSVLIEEVPVVQEIYQPLLHLVLCRKREHEQMCRLMAMMRREVHKR